MNFIKDNKPAIDTDNLNYKLICPRVIRINKNLYKMYFSTEKKNKDKKKKRYHYYKKCSFKKL